MTVDEREKRINRQQEWATAAAEMLRHAYIPSCPALLITYGWPRGWRGSYKGRKAVAVYRKAADGSAGVIFLIPTAWDKPSTVLVALLVEMVKAAFNKHAARLHLRGIGITTDENLQYVTYSDEIGQALDQLAEMLGEFPAAPMPETKSKSGGRLRRYKCETCGNIAYTSRDAADLACWTCQNAEKPCLYIPAAFGG